jgi:hypothetical protein
MRKIFLVLSLAFMFSIIALTTDAASDRGREAHSQVYSVRVNCDNLRADAGDDEDIDEDETVKLDGSVDGDYDKLDWDCSGGKLSNDGILRPTYDPPANYDGRDNEKTYTCTLTARNECGSDSDSVKITVNYEAELRDFAVVLRAKPNSGCAPLNNVDLTATLKEYGSRDYDYTYKFDCDNDGDYEKTVTTEDTEYIARDLCDYRNDRSYTARVRVEGRNKTVSDTVIVRANDCNNGDTNERGVRTGQVSITKMVRNISRGSNYQGSVTANPSDVISYSIVVTAVSGDSNNVLVSDTMPAGLINTGGLQLDGVPVGGNLFSGIYIGDLAAGQTKTITYNAVVAGKESFSFGQTALTSVATVTAGGSSATSYTTVSVYRSSVSGATSVATGVGQDLNPALAATAAFLLWVALLAAKTNPITR